jgi:CubicO group peptidase (beta-lactamase class C family)
MINIRIIYFTLILLLTCTSKPVPVNLVKYQNKVQQKIGEYDDLHRNSTIINKAAKFKSIDSLFNNYAIRNQFNGNVLVAQEGVLLYKKSFGYSDPAIGDILKDNSIFQLASVSKTVTAVAVLMLMEQQYFKLDDLVSKYFTDFPYEGVTIRHLLCHRSGLPNYLYFPANFYPATNMYLSNQDVYDVMVKYKPKKMLNPDVRFFYNNTNYMLLALLIEKVTGSSYTSYIQKHIFDVVGMPNSHAETPEEHWNRPNRTYGLYANNRHYPIDRFDGVYGDKGLYSTTEDMWQFDKSLYPDVLLTEQTLNEAFTNHVTEPRRFKQYGLGFRMKPDADSNKIIYHNGWWHGYRTAFHRREKDGTTIIVLSNRLNQTVYSSVKLIFNILDQKKGGADDEDDE